MRYAVILASVLVLSLLTAMPGSTQQTLAELESAGAAGITLGFVTVDGKRTQVTNGEYLFVFVPLDGGAPPTFTSMTVGGSVPNPPPPPPPPVDTVKRVRNAIASVVSPKKSEEARNSASAIRVVIQQAEAGEIVTSKALAGVARAFVMAANYENASAWDPLTNVMSEVLVDCVSVPMCVEVLDIIAKELEAIQ